MKLLTFILLLSFGHLQARTLVVKSDGNYVKIKNALVAAQNGDTILVNAGTYKEKKLEINKSIVLIANGKVVLDGENEFEILAIKANGVIVDGFIIQNSGVSSMIDFAGIKIYNVRDVVIKNNTLLNCFFGIYSQVATNCTIIGNVIKANVINEQQSANGIHCWKSDSMHIIANQISGHRDGIYFEFVTNSIIWRNISTNNLRYGLHFMFSNNDTYVSNTFEQNGAGVAVMFSNHVKMFSNYFRENWGDAAYGILLKEISDSHIQGNTFEKNTIGIYIEGASRIHMEKNSFTNNGWGIKIQASCMDIALKYNEFIQNTFDVATNGSLVLNTFDNNYWDKYEGYDIDRNNIGDIPYRPVTVFSMIIEKNLAAMMLFRSFITTVMDKSERVLPSITPENLKDNKPLMKPFLQ